MGMEEIDMSQELRESIRGLMGRARQDLAELVAFRSVAIEDPDHREQCAQAAAWVADAFSSIGFTDVAASPTSDGSSAVHGVAPGPEGSPTVLLYSHYDVQPALGEASWDVPVWELSERDGRWYGRGSADCKGNIAMHLLSLRALIDVAGELPCTVKFICEGSEEQGTGGLETFVPENADLLSADAICVVDTGNVAVGMPTLTTSLRGMVSVDIRLEALASVLHSGMFGGPAPDPVAGMIHVLGSLNDERGNCTVDGLAAGGTWKGVQYSEEQFRKDATVLDGVGLIGTGTIGDLLWARPAVTVLGIDIPSVAESAPAIQASCTARVSLRLPFGQPADDALGKLTAHLRRRVPWGLRCEITPAGSGEAFEGSLGGPAFDAMSEAMSGAFGREMATSGQGGSIPLCNVLQSTFPDAEIMLYGVEEPRCQIHAPNESVDPSEIEHVALAQAMFLSAYGRTRQ